MCMHTHVCQGWNKSKRERLEGFLISKLWRTQQNCYPFHTWQTKMKYDVLFLYWERPTPTHNILRLYSLKNKSKIMSTRPTQVLFMLLAAAHQLRSNALCLCTTERVEGNKYLKDFQEFQYDEMIIVHFLFQDSIIENRSSKKTSPSITDWTDSTLSKVQQKIVVLPWCCISLLRCRHQHINQWRKWFAKSTEH